MCGLLAFVAAVAGAEPTSGGPEELRKFIVSETAKWRDIIQKAGIEPN